jgi:hypothetical protein
MTQQIMRQRVPGNVLEAQRFQAGWDFANDRFFFYLNSQRSCEMDPRSLPIFPSLISSTLGFASALEYARRHGGELSVRKGVE